MLWWLLRCWHIVFPAYLVPATSCVQLSKTPQHVARVPLRFKTNVMVVMRAIDIFHDSPYGGERGSSGKKIVCHRPHLAGFRVELSYM